jgi:hypothetical protein
MWICDLSMMINWILNGKSCGHVEDVRAFWNSIW